MATSKAASPRKGAGRPSLPPVTVARLEELGYLIERVVASNQALFIEKGQEYKAAHRAGSSRPLSPQEAAQVAAVLADDDLMARAEQVQASSLRAYDEPDGRDILFAAGIGVAPAFLKAVTRVIALVEMPAKEFKQAREGGTLAEEVDQAARLLDDLDISVGGPARKRATAAFEHYARAAGFEPGEALSLPWRAVRQALEGAMTHLLKDASASSQLTGSLESTGGAEETSSTGSPGGKPSN